MWPEVRLGDYVDMLPGFAFKSKQFTDNPDDVPLVKGADVQQGFIEWTKCKRWPRADIEKYGKFRLSEGDVVVAMDRPWVPAGFKYAWIKGGDPSALLVQRVARLRGENGLSTRFLRYVIGSTDFVDYITPIVTGVNVPHISGRQICDFRFRLPPAKIQETIVSILSAYDDLIENNTRRIAILDNMARALYCEWFVHFRFPGHRNVPRVASMLGPIPRGWDIVTIDAVCSCVTDGSHSSPKSVERGLPMASSKDMHDWGLSLDTCRHISREDFDELVRNGCRPKRGDVLITKDGANYLKHIFVMRDEPEVVLLSSIAILRPNERVNPHLLTAILRAPENKERLKKYVTGAAIPRIILKDFKGFLIPLPSQDIQSAWVKTVQPMFDLCWHLLERITNLRHTRDLLLPRLISGEIDVSNIADAPVEATA